MSQFKKTQTLNYARAGVKSSSDSVYWKNLEFPVTVKEHSAIDYIDVSSTEPHYIAVTAGLKVDIYHQQTAKVWKTMSRFQSKAYGGTFRQDGQLLVAGAQNGHVMLFNYRLKQLLRIFKGHNGPVHRAKFIPGTSNIVSFSDDKSISIWDMTDESRICQLTGHSDFIRAGCVNPASDHIVLSGSYDHTVKMWDTRTGDSVLSVDHEAPVESIICYPSGSVFVSAGGDEVRVWDAISRRLLSKFSHHHKTITCLSLASDNRRLVSGSLDRHLKIYDVDTYSVVHTIDYLASVLSLAIAPGDSTVAVGMISSGSGLLSFQHRKDPEKNPPPMAKKKAADIRNCLTDNFIVSPVDEVVHHVGKDKMTPYDKNLRKFEYSKAVDAVMRPFVRATTPHVPVSVFKELSRRKGLRSALAGRNQKTLTPIVRFVTQHIRNPKFKLVMLEVANCILDIYEDHINDFPFLLNLIRKLYEEVDAEIDIANDNIEIMGLIELFIASSDPQTTRESERIGFPSTLNSMPSSKPKNTSVTLMDQT